MSDNTDTFSSSENVFKEAVCIDVNRIYDSCCDKDCLEDLRVYFTNTAQPIIDAAYTVKARQAEVINAFIDCEPVPFNQGFYSLDITYYFSVKLEVYTSPIGRPACAEGLAITGKRVILYGSEGNIKVFTNHENGTEQSCSESGSRRYMPKAVVQVATPMILSVKFQSNETGIEEEPVVVPAVVSRRFEGEWGRMCPEKTVSVTLGLFTICQLERAVQVMIPAYDFCIPDKERICRNESPCDIFDRIKFPTDDFFPPRLDEMGHSGF
ncbi:MAG: hypothetical protein FWG69_05295 [Oscillospiraceae bacterium]|nr:hypothetical protein [Oscillospiraceae bacterium]